LKTCKKEVSKWRHLLAVEINHTSNIMIETSMAETEAIVDESFSSSLPPEVTTIIVEARVRFNLKSNSSPEHEEKIATSYGTAFVVSSEGELVTNAHVVQNCKNVIAKNGAKKFDARILVSDNGNDLALLKVDNLKSIPATIRDGRNAKAGDYVAVFGFPLPGALSESGNLVEGNVTALAGLGGDARVYQISAPIQPGNSGGPLLDKFGNVAGIVNAKLDELLWARKTGSLPQNVNFAIKSGVLADFLDANSVAYNFGKADTVFDLTAIGERATAFTFQIACQK
jgi:serine protease Do